MVLKFIIYDANGRETGISRMRLEFFDKKWTIEDDPRGAWGKVTASKTGTFEVTGGGDTVMLQDTPPGKGKTDIVKLMNMPLGGDAGVGNAGTGKVLSTGGGIFWGFESATSSPLRITMVDLLVKNVPRAGLSSDDAGFKAVTGLDTKSLFANFWEPDPKTGIKPNITFTTCNAFLGVMANKLAATIGKKAGNWLSKGVLQLDWAGKDVPGSWIPFTGSNFPKPGDFYSISGYNQNNDFQQFKHVGIVAEIKNGEWSSIDGGQGGYKSKKDYVKWIARGPVSATTNFNGWIDIDKYFA